MPMSNPFDHTSFDSRQDADDRGECWGMNPESARRQFNVSAALAAILALVALAVAILGPVATVNVRREAAQTLVEAPKFKHIQRAEAVLPPGG
jgi:hypothetical protein